MYNKYVIESTNAIFIVYLSIYLVFVNLCVVSFTIL